MTKLRITPDGRIRGLWSDNVQLGELGVVRVWRASHVEFDNRLQRWTVVPAAGFGGPCRRILHESHSRAHALAWEHENFQPGGPFWPQLRSRFSNHPDCSPSHF